jgi:hypothetical protein
MQYLIFYNFIFLIRRIVKVSVKYQSNKYLEMDGVYVEAIW